MSRKTVAVVGAGLVGRLAGWAAMLSGYTPVLFYRGPYNRSVPRGFVYLHERCELPLDEDELLVDNFGTAEEYARRVYGDSEVKTSFWDTGPKVIYDPEQAISILEILQEGMLARSEFNHAHDVFSLLSNGGFDKVIVTIPVDKLFPEINFKSRLAYVRSFDAGDDVPNCCFYSGSPATSWHRAGVIFGRGFYEYTSRVVDGTTEVTKVVESDAAPPAIDNVLFTGRFGSWTKQLAHESFTEVLEWLSQ